MYESYNLKTKKVHRTGKNLQTGSTIAEYIFYEEYKTDFLTPKRFYMFL